MPACDDGETGTEHGSDPVIEFEPWACYRAVSELAVLINVAGRDGVRLEAGEAPCITQCGLIRHDSSASTCGD